MIKLKDLLNEAKLNVRDLPSYTAENPSDFENWYDDGMEIRGGKRLAPFSKSDENLMSRIMS